MNAPDIDAALAARAWIQGTVHAPVITPLDLKPEQINLDDIVHSLSQEPRYSGRCCRIYTVAEHSMIVAKAAELLQLSQEAQRWAIAHDFGEAFVRDISNPIKRTPIFDRYRELEREIDERIRTRFGIVVNADELAAVRALDMEACNIERRHLLPPEPQPWSMPEAPAGYSSALAAAWALHNRDYENHTFNFVGMRRSFRLHVRRILGE